MLRREYDQQHRSTLTTVGVIIFVCVFITVSFFAVSVIFPSSSDEDADPAAQKPYQVPCIDADNYPLQASQIQFRVLNGSQLAGYATAVGEALSNKGFSVVVVDNTATTNDSQIRFGKNAIAAAYTLAGYFDTPTLIYDDRQDGLIDVVVGRGFTELKDSDIVQTADASQPLSAPSYCVHIDDITPQPALKHDTSLVAAYVDNKPPEAATDSSDSDTGSSSDNADSAGAGE
jgi:hypothetical protein